MKNVFKMRQKCLSTKKSNYVKIESFYSSKDSIKIQRKSIEWEKIFVIQLIDKELTSMHIENFNKN